PPEIRQFENLMGKINLGNTVEYQPQGECVHGGNMVVSRQLYQRLGGMEPDQIGRLVAGSGDVGLCRRAQDLGYQILWVPEARVYHYQSLRRNGCLRDLMRREFNNGISRAFEDLKLKPVSNGREWVLKFALRKTARLPIVLLS